MDGTIPKQPPLSPAQKNDWNRFIDFVDKEGFKGNPTLDDKNKQLGNYLMQKFQSLNPKTTITYNDVPRVQQELQNYRTDVVNQWKANKSIVPDAKSEDEIMPGLSGVDGWFGSKTSSHKFPTATYSRTENGQTTTTNYGTDTQRYDADMAKQKGTNE